MFDGVKTIIDLYKPDYIIVNSAGMQLGHSGPVNMEINDIKELHNYYPQGKLIASHMDNIEFATLSRADIRTSEIKDCIYIPADGEIMQLN